MCLNDWIYEGIHFGLFSVHEWPASGVPPGAPIANKPKRPERDVVNMYIAPRREGYSEGYPHDRNTNWVYAQKPVVPRGPDGTFDRGMVWWGSSIVMWQDRHWIYYTGWPGGNMSTPYEPSVGLATLRLDGFVFLEPWVKEDVGWIITKPFRLEGSRIEVNADTRKEWIAAEVLNGMGDPIAGLSYKVAKRLQGVNGLRLQMFEDKQDRLEALRASVVRLKFYLQNARLYVISGQRLGWLGRKVMDIPGMQLRRLVSFTQAQPAHRTKFA